MSVPLSFIPEAASILMASSVSTSVTVVEGTVTKLIKEKGPDDQQTILGVEYKTKAGLKVPFLSALCLSK